MSTLNKEKIVNCIKESGKVCGNLFLSLYGYSLTQEGNQAFSDAIDIGIKNTISCLYDADVSDEEIKRVVAEHWGLSYDEIEDMLIQEKGDATIRALKQYLKLQGYSSPDIKKFMLNNKAAVTIRHNHELWKLRKNPQKLLKALQPSMNREK